MKCRNFLATLLRLASDQPDTVAKNVRELIQVKGAESQVGRITIITNIERLNHVRV